MAITAIGTYFSPWLSYGLASVYNAVDQIVVVNYGFQLDNKRRMGPLKEASEVIKHLDVNGKIKEVTHVDPKKLRHSYPVGTQRAANLRRKREEGEGSWYDIRGLNLTAANELAFNLGADWILKFDSDEVCYRDVEKLREDIGTYVFHQYEFAGLVGGSENYFPDPGPASPYIDTVQTYKADLDTWYLGAGAIANHPEDRKPTDLFHCAHLRWANPVGLFEEEKYNHLFGRRVWQLYTNDYGYFSDGLFKEAMDSALLQLQRKGTPTEQKPPEACCFQDPLEYISK